MPEPIPAEKRAEILSLVARLSSPEEEIRQAAEREIRQIDPQTVHYLLLLYDRAPREIALRYFHLHLFIMCVLIVAGGYLSWLFKKPILDYLLSSLPSYLCLSFLTWLTKRYGTNIQQQFIHALGFLEGGRVLGLLADLLAPVDTHTGMAKKSLKRLLPEAKISDLRRLNIRQRQNIYKLLLDHAGFDSSAADLDFALMLLDKVERMADAQALPYIQQLTRIGVSRPRRRAIHEKAFDLVPFFTELWKQAEIGSDLLRPSGSDEASTDSLLRAAHDLGETAPQQLLRPTMQEDS